jgi:predicted ester cyclase
MSIKENKALARRWFEPQTPPEMADVGKVKDPKALIEKLIRTGVEEFFSPDVIIHLPSGEGNRETIVQENVKSVSAFPDMTFKLDKLIAEGDMVAVLGKMIVPSKKKEAGYMAMVCIVGGKFVEVWASTDYSTSRKQLE